MAELMPALFHAYPVRDLSIEETEIEEIVRQLYQGNISPRPD